MLFLKKNKKLILNGIISITIILIVVVGVIIISNNTGVSEEENIVESNLNEEAINENNVVEKKEEVKNVSADKKIEETNTDNSVTSASTISSNNDAVCKNDNPTCEMKVDPHNEQVNVEVVPKEESPKETPSVETPLVEIKKEIVTLKGYLIDEDCFVCYPDPAKETLGCLTMPECAASGFGIAFKDGGKYKFYIFDGNISTYSNGERIANATGGQQLTWDFINEYVSEGNIPVKVTGYLTGEARTNPDPSTADNIYYQVFKVNSITE